MARFTSYNHILQTLETWIEKEQRHQGRMSLEGVAEWHRLNIYKAIRKFLKNSSADHFNGVVKDVYAFPLDDKQKALNDLRRALNRCIELGITEPLEVANKDELKNRVSDN